MQAIILALLKKAAPYLALAGFSLGIGLYLGYHIGSDGLAAARLALSVQEADDAKAVAAANVVAAAELAKSSADANAAEAALAVANRQASLRDTDLVRQIAAQAVQPGQDAPDAPVLVSILDSLGGSQ